MANNNDSYGISVPNHSPYTSTFIIDMFGLDKNVGAEKTVEYTESGLTPNEAKIDYMLNQKHNGSGPFEWVMILGAGILAAAVAYDSIKEKFDNLSDHYSSSNSSSSIAEKVNDNSGGINVKGTLEASVSPYSVGQIISSGLAKKLQGGKNV
ncbi:hypothetical protein C0585_05835 [Candidatus Woesearchaeota archaeon]|nr:MAG: hypothetical protein C0585_05835 [Candidatus Woesearchaeota archaeon]